MSKTILIPGELYKFKVGYHYHHVEDKHGNSLKTYAISNKDILMYLRSKHEIFNYVSLFFAYKNIIIDHYMILSDWHLKRTFIKIS